MKREEHTCDVSNCKVLDNAEDEAEEHQVRKNISTLNLIIVRFQIKRIWSNVRMTLEEMIVKLKTIVIQNIIEVALNSSALVDGMSVKVCTKKNPVNMQYFFGRFIWRYTSS